MRGVGVNWVRTLDADLRRGQDARTLKEALTTAVKGPKVLIAQSECMLNKQRREKPLVRKAVAGGERVVRERFGVDRRYLHRRPFLHPAVGLPFAVGEAQSRPAATEPVAKVLDSCVGCGLCGEVAHAAVLCPSFYKA